VRVNETGCRPDNVKLWLNEQGYPTEFKTANVCSNHGFRVWQGSHVRDPNTNIPREIDVLATADYLFEDHLIRVEHVIECKWSRDKPWIVFTSHTGRMASSACVAQTIGNLLGSAAIWMLAGDARLHTLDVFYTPERPGFGGRQAFSKNIDLFYSAVSATAELSHFLASKGDPKNFQNDAAPRNLVLTFPVVVVEGLLYEAYFDESADGISLEEKRRVRLHWRGAPSSDLITTIDIVSLDHLDEFMALRAEQMKPLLAALHEATVNIDQCFKEQSLKNLSVSEGSRGIVGLPHIFRELEMLDSVRKFRRARKPKSKKS
jgi:hypothetical protein